MKNNELAFNKTNFANLKKERDMLKITLQYITEENENLKNELNDMKITAKKNKDMLKEYVYQITNKDKLFEKMTSTIEQLKSRLEAMEQFKKIKKKKEKDFANDFMNYNNNNPSTATNSNNYTTNNIITTTGGENNYSFGFHILNNNNIKKCKKNIINEINNKSNKSTSNIPIDNKGFNILKNKNNENIIIKKEINNINNKPEKNFNNQTDEKNSNEMKYFFEKQKRIMEEIDNIKDDIQFLMENRSKSKMREKLNQSITYNNNLNSSLYSEQKNPDNNNISFTSEKNSESSYLSNLSVTYNGPDPNMLRQLNYDLNISHQNNNIDNFNISNENRKISNIKSNKYNLKDKYLINENFTKFINQINIKKEMLFLIDGKNKVWEILPRGDFTVEQIQNYEKENKIKSVINLGQEKNNNLINMLISNKENNNYFGKEENENLIDIKIKDPADLLFK